MEKIKVFYNKFMQTFHNFTSEIGRKINEPFCFKNESNCTHDFITQHQRKKLAKIFLLKLLYKKLYQIWYILNTKSQIYFSSKIFLASTKKWDLLRVNQMTTKQHSYLYHINDITNFVTFIGLHSAMLINPLTQNNASRNFFYETQHFNRMSCRHHICANIMASSNSN